MVLEVGKTVMKTISNSIKDVKKRGTILKEKHLASRHLYNAALTPVGKYHKFGSAISNFLGLRRLYQKAPVHESEWWKSKPRKPRKDKVKEEVKEKIIACFLSPQISREVPNKKDVMKTDKERINRHLMTIALRSV